MATHAYKTRFNKNYFEEKVWSENKLLCGIDEVGRGCLAGPVIVAAVVLFPHKTSRHLRDSKIMTPEERQKAYHWIIKNSWHSIALVHHRIIDTHNIYYATLLAMKRAYMQLAAHIAQKPSTIIIDAMPLRLENSIYTDTEIFYFPFGERKSSSIAAASIVAKVTRDRLIATQFDAIIPGYQLKNHKGYSTPPHKKLVRSLGPSIIHRTNFVKKVLSYPDESNQISLFNENEPMNPSVDEREL